MFLSARREHLLLTFRSLPKPNDQAGRTFGTTSERHRRSLVVAAETPRDTMAARTMERRLRLVDVRRLVGSRSA